MNTSIVAPPQRAIVGRRVCSQRELDILSLERRLQAVLDAREYCPEILFKIVPESGADIDGGLVGDLVRAARAVAGNGLLLDRYDRELIARRPWYSRYLDYVEGGWDGLSPDTREICGAMSTGTLGESQLGRLSARVDLLIGAAEKLIEAVAPPAEEPKRKRAHKAASRPDVHVGL